MMIHIITFFFFLLTTYGLGAFFVRGEPFIIKIAVGLAAIPVIGTFLNLLHVPLDWRIFLGLALIAPFQHILRRLRREAAPQPPPSFPSWHTIALLVVFVFAVILFCWGSFQYPWLENDDPWAHAAGIQYIALEKNLNAPPATFQYLNPYPPAYDLLFGLLYQTNTSLYWTLKFFNGFIISLGFLFFYYFVKEFAHDKNKAVFATFFLLIIPCYLTHFIWAHALIMTLMFPAFYFLLKTFREKTYLIPAGICWAAIALTQPTQTIKFMIMALLMISAHSSRKIQWKNISMVVLLSTLLAGVWWGPVIVKALHGSSEIVYRHGTAITGMTKNTLQTVNTIFSPNRGTATQAYSWEHFVFIAHPNLITNPTGLGPVIMMLGILGLMIILIKILRTQDNANHPYFITTLLWLGFTFLGINSMTFNLPVGLFAFRFWMLFAIPVALLCSEVLHFLIDFMQIKRLKISVVILILLCVLRTSLPFKWRINTGCWSYGVHWASDDDISGYLWMKDNLPPKTKVFAFTDNALVIGHDMLADFWSLEYRERLGDAFSQKTDTLYQNLTALDFECLVISPRDIWKFGREEVNQKLKSLIEDNRLRLLYNNPAVKIFQILK